MKDDENTTHSSNKDRMTALGALQRLFGTGLVGWGQGMPSLSPLPLRSASKCLKYKIPTIYRLLALDRANNSIRFPFPPSRGLFPFQLVTGPLASHSLILLKGFLLSPLFDAVSRPDTHRAVKRRTFGGWMGEKLRGSAVAIRPQGLQERTQTKVFVFGE